MNAWQLGPARDLNRVRIGRPGSLRVERKTLLFVGGDGQQVSITLDSSADMLALANELHRASMVVDGIRAARDFAGAGRSENGPLGE
jgi:hypothetical protein